MDERVKTGVVAPQSSSVILHKPCAFNPAGASQTLCFNYTKVLRHNMNGCCGDKNRDLAPCTSPYRACWACIFEGGGGFLEPGLVAQVEKGLCDWHNINGPKTKRPKDWQQPALPHETKAEESEGNEAGELEGSVEGEPGKIYKAPVKTRANVRKMKKQVPTATKMEALAAASKQLSNERGNTHTSLKVSDLLFRTQEILGGESKIGMSTLRVFWYKSMSMTNRNRLLNPRTVLNSEASEP